MQKNIPVQYPYVVFQFLELPHADIDDYSCVPHSWIRRRRETDRNILVAYPEETPSITKMRIMNGDEPSKKWKLYMAIKKLESHSYENACEFINEKIHNASRNSDVMRIGYKHLPAKATKRCSPPLKTIKLPDRQSKKNRNKKVVDKAKMRNMILNSIKVPEHCNVESRPQTSSKLTDFVSSKNTVIKEIFKKAHQNQTSRDVPPNYDDLLLRYPNLQLKPEKDKGAQVNNPASSRSTEGKTLYASKTPLAFVNQACNYSQKPQENQLLSIHRKHLHHLALTRGIQNKRIPNLRTFTLDIPEPLTQDPNILCTIQNPINEDSRFSQLEIPNSSPVIQEHPHVLPKQKTPEVERATSEPTAHRKMTSTSHASITCSNFTEYQDSTVEDMVVDESTQVSCIEQNVLFGTKTENEYSANPKTLEEANHSGENVERTMEEESPIIDTVTLSEITLTQDVDDDEHNNCSGLNSDEIINNSSNLNKPSLISVLNQADVWADQLVDIFQQMKVNLSETCEIAQDLHKSLLQSQPVIECISNAVENWRALKKGKVAVVTSKEVTGEIQELAEKNQAERKEEESPIASMQEDKKNDKDADSKCRKNYDDRGRDIGDVKDQDRDNEVPKTTRGHIRTFVLPPEYDPHDTRWTLKYRENDPELNLIELVPGSNVFINSLKLSYCKLTAKDSKELARMILVEIFSRSALSVCSLTGVRANAFDISGTNVRPGLDEKARISILSFVKEHARERKWTFDSQSVINSLRSKIQEIRAKFGKTA